MNAPDWTALLQAARPELAQPALLTGGSGRLGRELRQLLPELQAPGRTELDVREPAAWLERERPALIIHAAAFTDVAAAEERRGECWNTNVHGTRSLARAAARIGARFVLISTDYVFAGLNGNYQEEDTPGPVRNYYALSKLAAEEAARGAMPEEQLLVIRTSFRAREWPHERAFTDLYTSQDYVDRLAPQLASAICLAGHLPFDTVHIAGPRRSSFELARERRPDVQAASRLEAPVKLPADVSLNTERWLEFVRERSLLLG